MTWGTPNFWKELLQLLLQAKQCNAVQQAKQTWCGVGIAVLLSGNGLPAIAYADNNVRSPIVSVKTCCTHYWPDLCIEQTNCHCFRCTLFLNQDRFTLQDIIGRSDCMPCQAR